MERGTGISPTQTGQIVKARRLAFVLAKGGITSSDVATEALAIDRAWIRGSLLPGIVSPWEPVPGPQKDCRTWSSPGTSAMSTRWRM